VSTVAQPGESPAAATVGDVQAPNASMPLWHVGLSVADLHRTHHWYHETLGLMFARATNLFIGPQFTWTLGLRGAAATCWWLNDRQDLFQLELFQFKRPLTRALPAEWRPCDIGYSGISFHVEDLDATLARAARCGSPPLSPTLGEAGARRACVRDPDGVLIELMEEDPRDRLMRARPRMGVPAVARSITLSVADLGRSCRLFVEGFGLSPATNVELHRPEHEALWGLAGAARDSALFWAGDFLIELVSYRRPRPKPRPSSYRISDRGLFHLCFGSLDRSQFRDALRQCRAAGCVGNSPAIPLGVSAATFMVDGQDFTIEMLYRHPRLRQSTDATPRDTPKSASTRSDASREVRQRKRYGSAFVVGADTVLGTELCELLLEDETSVWLVDPFNASARRLDERMSLDRGADQTVPLDALAELAHQQDGRGSIPGPVLLLGLPRASTPSVPRSPMPSSLAAMSSLISLIGRDGVDHVAAIAARASAGELTKLRDQLSRTSCTCTTAMVARPASGILGGPLRATFTLTAREAAERIYLAALQRRSTVWPRPNPWPPRRGASEAPSRDGVCLLPIPQRARPPSSFLVADA
jgi:catechol 2,3-dioxygenase-like lactoylglutathione lyase family enzyme